MAARGLQPGGALWSAWGGPGLSMEQRGGGEGGAGAGRRPGGAPNFCAAEVQWEVAFHSRPHLMEPEVEGELESGGWVGGSRLPVARNENS